MHSQKRPRQETAILRELVPDDFAVRVTFAAVTFGVPEIQAPD